jgi:2'-hydroxyisoflavone reductase
MNILVFGGTQFVGRAIVEECLAGGHSVSLMHRGKTGADLFPECEHILGDRTDDVGKLAGRSWDAVIDVSGYYPKQVQAAIDTLKNSVKHYVFISTISVYDLENAVGPVTENMRVKPECDLDETEMTNETYGPLKVICERLLTKAFGDRLAVVRPGIIVGAHDHTGRFPYYISRFKEFEEVLLPDVLGQPIQGIDARDLAEFSVKLAEEGTTGVFNATGPQISFGALIDEIRTQVGREHKLVMASIEELEAHEVKPWGDLPLIFKSKDQWANFEFDTAHAEASGLDLSPVEDTVEWTLDWVKSMPAGERPGGKYGMTRERELEVIAKLQESRSVTA